MRKRERDDVAAAARRRLEVLSAELSDLHPATGPGHDRWSPRSQPVVRPASSVPTRPAQQWIEGRKPPGPEGLTRAPRRPPVPPGPGRPSPGTAEPRVPRPREPGPRPPGTDPVDPQVPEPDDPDDREWSFLEAPDPVLAGAPGGLLDARALIHTPVGRPLPPDPARVPPPGRHAVAHGRGARGGSMTDWVDERLPGAVRGRVSLTGQHVKVLSGILGIALVLAGWLALHSGSRSETVPGATYVAQKAGTSGPARASANATATDAGTSAGPDDSVAMVGATGGTGDVVVDVVGKVRRPGIVTLPSGSRVNDAVLKAGGLRRGAHTEGLNLARVLVDGEQIVVGQPAGATPGATVPGATSTAPPTGSESSATGALVNLNTADLTQLDTLPGVGPVTAQKILDWRTAHGAFSSVDELLEVDGIGDKTLADIAPRATL